MFAAIGRIFRSLGFLLTGRFNKAYKSLLNKTVVVEATYENVIAEKKKRITEYTNAVATMITNDERKKLRKNELVKDVEELVRLQAGALAKGKKRAEALGGDPEVCAKDPEFIHCQTAHRDFASTLKEKQKSLEEVSKDLADISKTLNQHKASIESLMRDLEKIKEEKGTAVADLISAQEEKKLAQLFAGISEDKTAKDLEDVRNVINETKAAARVTREISGMDSKRSENEFLAYAVASEADDEFSRLVGLTKDKVSTPVVDTTKIAE